MSQRYVERGVQAQARRDISGAQRACNKALHIGRTSTEQSPVSLHQCEWIGCPSLAFDRDDVRVARQDYARPIWRTQASKQIGLGANPILYRQDVKPAVCKMVTDE